MIHLHVKLVQADGKLRYEALSQTNETSTAVEAAAVDGIMEAVMKIVAEKGGNGELVIRDVGNEQPPSRL